MADEVDNEYKLALGEEMPNLRGKASICSFAFFEAEDALEKEAWTSTTADTFSTALKDHHRTAGNAGENAGTAIENRYDGEPDKVASDDPRATWTG